MSISLLFNTNNYDLYSDSLTTNTLTATNLEIQNLITDEIEVTYTTQSTSSSSGSLIVSGGAGIAKNLYVGGLLSIGDNPVATLTNISLGGAVATTTNLYIYQIDRLIILKFPYLSTSATASSQIFSGAGAIPSIYCPPTNNINMPVCVISGGTTTLGTFQLQPSGLFQFYVGGQSLFSATGNNGWYQTTITYIL